jgi:hypothetical protein
VIVGLQDAASYIYGFAGVRLPRNELIIAEPEEALDSDKQDPIRYTHDPPDLVRFVALNELHSAHLLRVRRAWRDHREQSHDKALNYRAEIYRFTHILPAIWFPSHLELLPRSPSAGHGGLSA